MSTNFCCVKRSFKPYQENEHDSGQKKKYVTLTRKFLRKSCSSTKYYLSFHLIQRSKTFPTEMTPTNCPAKERKKQKKEAGTANQYWFFNPVILMVISASRIPCILSIPNLTLNLLENPESWPSNKANPGSREILRGGKKTKGCEKRAGTGERPSFFREQSRAFQRVITII